ncbi:MAG: reductase [Ilumatobacteraceae bacterium]|nr:reductase [Ilumatobacteraceae bacterium]
MSAATARTVGADDRVGVVAVFDDTATAVFAALCRLTAGDGGRGIALLVETYGYLERAARRTNGVTVDRDWMIDAAHSVYVALDGGRRPDDRPPVGALSAIRRVTVSLLGVEHRSATEVAILLDVDESTVASALASGSTLLTAASDAAGGANPSAADVIRRCEVWLDDSTRLAARTSVAEGRTGADTGLAPSGPWRDGADARAAAMLGNPWAHGPALEGSEPFRRPAEFVRPRRSRLITIGTVAAIAGALVGLAVWLSPSSTDHAAGTAITDPSGATNGAATPTTRPSINGPTTTVTSDTVPATDAAASSDPSDSSSGDTVVLDPATGLPVETPGFVIDPLPDGLIGTSAGSNGRSTENPINWFEAWASPDAARTSGRWFAVLSIDNFENALPSGVGLGARRVDVAGNRGLLENTADGAQRLTVELPGRQQIEYQAFGFSDDDLVRLAAAASFGPHNAPTFAADASALFDGLDVVTSRPTTQSVMDFQIVAGLTEGARASYQTDDAKEFLTVLTGPQVENDLRLATLLSPASSDPAAAFASDRTIVLRGRTMYTGELPLASTLSPDISAFQFIEWHEGDRTVMIVGLVPMDLLFTAATNAHIATAQQWADLIDAPRPASTGPQTVDAGSADSAGIGRTTTSSGIKYVILLSTNHGTSLVVDEERPTDPSSTSSAQTQTTESGVAITIDPDHPLIELNSIEATIVSAVFVGAPTAAGLRVTVDGFPPVDTPIVQVGSTNLFGAATAFSEMSSGYTASLIDARGLVIQVLDH